MPLRAAGPVRVLYAAIIVAISIIVALALWQGAIGAKEVAVALLALVGTYVGATLAFRLNQAKEDEKIHQDRRAALFRALFVLGRQINAVQQLKLGYEAYDNPNERAFSLSALSPPTYSDLAHNFSDLGFLLESDDPNVMFRLSVEQERFEQVLTSIRKRNEFHVNEYQPRIAAAGVAGKKTSIENLRGVLGDAIFNGVMARTENVYALLTKTSRSLEEMQTELHGIAKKLYPKTKFLTFTVSP